MPKERFEHLHFLVEPLIKKQDTRFGKLIPTLDRLVIILRYLSSGCSQQNLSFNFSISGTTVSKIVAETCDTVYEAFAPIIQKRTEKKPVINTWICGTCRS